MHVFIASDVYDYGKTLHFPKNFFFWKIHFGECQNLTNSNLGIWSIAQKRYPNLSYESKRDCASIAPHTKLKKEIAKQISNPFLVPPGGTKLWPRNDFSTFACQKPKLKNQGLKKNIKKHFKNPIWENQLLYKNPFWKNQILKIKLFKNEFI